MLAVLLALAASSSWGLADFLGGLKSRSLPVPLVLLAVEGTGLALVLAVIALTGEPLPAARTVLLSLGAGAAGITALGCFYRALAIGTMGVVAPVSATGVALPVVVGILTGDALSTVVSLGLALTVVGVLLASREEPHGDAARVAASRASIALALVAALGFGAYFVAADVAADDSVLWLLAVSRIVAMPVLVPLALRGARGRLRRADLGPLLLAGTLDVAATGLYGLATREGALSIVAVVGGLYPIVTVLLARVVLGERLQRLQAAGVAAALAGVVLIAAG